MTATWTITRAQLIDAIASIKVRGTLLPGRADPVVLADDMADAILSQLPVITSACDTGAHFDCDGCACTCHPGATYP